MSSVNLIQLSEPRVQPANNGRTAGEPFADLLESAAVSRRADSAPRERPSPRQAPAAPKSRGEARSEALSRTDVREVKPAAKGREAIAQDGAHAPAETEADAAEATERTPTNTQQPETESEAETLLTAEDAGEAAETAAPAEGEGEDENEGHASTSDTAALPGDETPDDAANVTPDQADADMVTAAAEPSEQTIVTPTVQTEGETPAPLGDEPADDGAKAAANSPAAAPVAPTDTPPPAAGTQAAATSAKARPAHAATPANPAVTEPGEGVTVPATPATPAQPRAAAGAEQPQLQQAPQTNVVQAAANNEASTPFEREGDGQSAQQQKNAPLIQAKPQDSKGADQAEAVKAAPPLPDPAAPKAQPTDLPAPVRALAATLNPASVNPVSLFAATGERAPVPLTGTALAVEIVSRMRDGMRRFDIRLDPPELGRVDVRLDLDRHGNVKTKLTVDRPETLELMQREARGLERALQQAGLKTDGGGLEFSLRSHADNGHAEGHAGRGNREADPFVDEGGERIEAVIDGYKSAALARGGIDIRI